MEQCLSLRIPNSLNNCLFILQEWYINQLFIFYFTFFFKFMFKKIFTYYILQKIISKNVTVF